MTVPKIRTVSKNGSRYYVHPVTREKAASVTSIVGMLPKGFLMYWAAKVVAECAVDNVGTVVDLAIKDPKGAVDYLKRAPGRDTRSAANKGDTVHDLTARIAQGEKVGKLHPELAPYIDGFRFLLEKLEVEFLYTETTIWNERLGIGGSFDHLVTIPYAKLGEPEREGRAILMADTKTTRSGVHAEVALQLKGYSLPDNVIFVEEGGQWVEKPLPGPIEGGLVFHLRPERSRAVLINLDARLHHPIMLGPEGPGSTLEIDLEEVLRALAIVHFWDRELNTTVILPDLLTYEV